MIHSVYSLYALDHTHLNEIAIMGEQTQQNMYNIKGLPRPDNAKRGSGKIPYVPNLPLRYEISKLATSTDPVLKKQWTLFVLALDEFKSKPVADKLSYFQVAGIVRILQ
jgi:hypothetical protein